MGKTLMFLNPRKRKKSRRSSRRHHSKKHSMKMNPRKGRLRSGRRSGGKRKGGMAGGIMSSVKHAFSKELMLTGLGLFSTGVAFRILINKTTKATTNADGTKTYTSSLPLMNDQIGQTLYGVGVPIIVGMLTRRFSPAFSNGCYLGAANTLINTYLAPPVNTEVNKLLKVNATAAYIGGGRRLAGVPGVGRHTRRA